MRANPPRFRLPPEVFDALHLSALAHGGIGRSDYIDNQDAPVCYIGHLASLGVVEDHMVIEPFGFGETENDSSLRVAGVGRGERTPFERWCELVGVDVAEAEHA